MRRRPPTAKRRPANISAQPILSVEWTLPKYTPYTRRKGFPPAPWLRRKARQSLPAIMRSKILLEQAKLNLGIKAQVYIYNRMLGRLQDFEPPKSYLLGRGWQRTQSGVPSSSLTTVVTRQSAREEVRRWCVPEHRAWAPAGSPVEPHARLVVDIVSRSIQRRRPSIPGRSAA